jgi:ribosomal protein S18 acetylase RimI-like enzyme
VDDALRGTGLGKVLLYLTLEAMAARGFHDAWFLWTGEATPAGHLYHRAGFTVTRTFDTYGKTLADG